MTLAYKTTKFTLGLAAKMIKADIRLHNIEAIKPDMSIVFVANHFTRLETLLLPLMITQRTGLEVWSLAANELFKGFVGSFLRATGNISTKDPDRDKIIIGSLLKGDHPWIIFPEGAMIKDKKLVNEKGEFEVYSSSGRRSPFTGAATLALRAEYTRQMLYCMGKLRDEENLKRTLDRYGLESAAQTQAKRTHIVPVNITYYPIRATENFFSKAAGWMNDGLSERAMEELAVEGSILGKASNIDITLGEPICVRDYLEGEEFDAAMSCGYVDLEALEENPKSLFNEAAQRLMIRYMGDIYRNTTINYDHIFATLIRHQRNEGFTERAYRNRVYLCAHKIIGLGKYRVHTLLERTHRDLIYEDHSPKFEDFMQISLAEGIIRKEGNFFYRNADIEPGTSDFQTIRLNELTYVLANEIEPLQDVTEIIREIAESPRARLSEMVREIFLQRDAAIFERDYEKHFQHFESKPPEVGRPYLLQPKRIKAGVVLVHGYLSAPLEVRRLAEFLCGEGYAVYAVRLKGHGTSPDDLAETKWEEWYESLNRGYTIIKSVTDNIVLGGFSTGGGIALLGAGKKGEKIRAAFSINAPLHLRNFAINLIPSIAAVNSVITRGRRWKTGRWAYLENNPENANINYHSNPVTAIKELNEAILEMERLLPQIQAPTLLVQGSKDPIVDPVSAQLLFSQVGTRDKELTIYDRDRHGIINGEGREAVYNRLRQFLESALAFEEGQPDGRPAEIDQSV